MGKGSTTMKPKKAAKPARAAGKARTLSAGKPHFIYAFGAGKADGRAQMKQLLGGKGANLAEMTNLGVPVPPGMTITTEVCNKFYELGEQWPKGLDAELQQKLKWLES